jgi:serine protease Do
LAQLQTALIGARDSGPKTPSRGVGTGFILRSDGYIVTNAHVIEGDGGTFAASIKVTTADGKTYAAVVVGADNKTDLAVIKIESTGLPAAKLGASSTMQLGDPVIAIGHPFGLIDTVTTGNISGVGREWASLKNMMQITGSVNPGNSGGPLFDLKGQVIGINTAKIGDQEHFFDIGFATPIDDGRPIVDKLMQFGSTERPWLGITIEEADAIAPDQGKTIVIADVTPFGPADKFGLSANDAIKQVNGKDVTSATAVQDIVAATPAGENIAFYVLRDGLPVEIEVTVGVHSYVNSAAVQTTK